jgi:hypothetical protein
MADVLSDDPRKQIRTVLLGATAALAVYAPAALWLQSSYVPLVGPPGAILLVDIQRLEGGGLGFRCPAHLLREFEDDQPNAQHSPAILYENNKPLGPAHSQIEDIAKLGGGRYSHRKTIGFVFSTSDNSSPNKNGRHYWAALPKSP